MLAETPKTAESGGGLVVVVGAVLRIGAEIFEARGEVRRGRRHDGKRVRAPVSVDRAHDRSQDARVPSAACTPEAETRASEAHAERGRPLLLVLLWLVISTLLILLLLLLWWWLSFRVCARPC
jgi:hypothetical protein